MILRFSSKIFKNHLFHEPFHQIPVFNYSMSYWPLGGVRGFIYGFIPYEEVQVVNTPQYPPLGLVDHLRRFSDGDTRCRSPPRREAGSPPCSAHAAGSGGSPDRRPARRPAPPSRSSAQAEVELQSERGGVLQPPASLSSVSVSWQHWAMNPRLQPSVV